MCKSFVAASIGVAALLACAFAVAEPAPKLTAPAAESSTEVPYPEGAAGDASVLLELLVEADGSVSRATVIDGAPPFAEQARTAALTWRFVPAQRDGTSVAARIRARVEFQQERADLSARAEPPVGAAGASEPVTPAKKAEPAERAREAESESAVEVTVLGARREIGQTTLDKSDVRAVPGGFGDAFRVIEALPGVTPIASGVPYFYMRGAPPNNAGYFVDGVRVPLLFHLGLGQSVIHPGFVDQVEFFPSAAPARYGGVAGGIVAGVTREAATAFHGEANLRLVDAGALLEAPFADGRGSALVAGRYGYPGPILGAITNDLKIDYWDYQARTSWKMTAHDTLSLFAFGSHDYLAARSRSGDPEASQKLVEQFVSDFHRVDLRYDRALSDGHMRLAVTGGYESQGAAPSYLTNHSIAARLELEQKLGQSLRLRAGTDLRLERYRVRITARGPTEPTIPQSAVPPPTNLSAGLYSDLVWRVAPRVEIVPGVRFGVFGSSRHNEAPSATRAKTVLPALEPRLSARVGLSAHLAWLSSVGVSHQYPSLRLGDVPAPIVSVPGFPFGVRTLQTALQASQGFEAALPADLVLTATGFYSYFAGLTDLSASCYQLIQGSPPEQPGEWAPPYVCPNNSPVHGRAYGVELMLRRSFSERLAGWLSYTLSRATRQAHFTTPSGADDVADVVSEFDRTHVLNAVLSYDLGRGWRVGGRFLFYTGTPYSRLEGSVPVPPYNAYRNPAFYRLDFRLEKRWRLGRSSSLAFVLEGQNVTLRKEITGLGLECEEEGPPSSHAETTCERSKIGPLTIPSVGVEAFF
jgi:TonB family protein